MWLGGSAAVMIHSIMKFDTCGRHFWGFDSFEGLPSPSVQVVDDIQFHSANSHLPL